jgi:hypothetical protein
MDDAASVIYALFAMLMMVSFFFRSKQTGI